MSNKTIQGNWPCSIAGCTREDRMCKRAIDLPTDPDEQENFIYPNIPGGEEHAYCEQVWEVMVTTLQAQENLAAEGEKDPDAEEMNAKTIYEGIQRRVHGQDSAIKSLAILVWEELFVKPELRKNEDLLEQRQLQPEDIRKNNGVIVGPTGSGKTYMLQVVGQQLGIPFYLYRNTAELTEAGYVGSDVDEIILHALMHTMNWLKQHTGEEVDIEELVKRINAGEQRLMIGIDEFDKLAKPDSKRNTGRDVSGGGVQNALLTLLEGQEVAVNLGSKQQPMTIMVDTTFIAFVAVGAFSEGPNGESMEAIVKKRLGGGDELGRPTEEKEQNPEYYLKVLKKDLQAFGFMDQILGRLNMIMRLRRLSVEDLKFILTSIRANPLERYRAQYKFRGFELRVDDDAIEKIAERSHAMGTGARGMEEVMFETFREVSFLAESMAGKANLIHISSAMVERRGKIFEEGEEEGVPATFQKVNLIEAERVTAPLPEDIPYDSDGEDDPEPDDD